MLTQLAIRYVHNLILAKWVQEVSGCCQEMQELNPLFPPHITSRPPRTEMECRSRPWREKEKSQKCKIWLFTLRQFWYGAGSTRKCFNIKLWVWSIKIMCYTPWANSNEVTDCLALPTGTFQFRSWKPPLITMPAAAEDPEGNLVTMMKKNLADIYVF